MVINRNHWFVTSEKCVGEEDNVSLSMDINIFPPFLHMQSLSLSLSFFFFLTENQLSGWVPFIFLLLPFSNLEVNCCFRQHEFSHMGLARLQWPDGFGAFFPCRACHFPSSQDTCFIPGLVTKKGKWWMLSIYFGKNPSLGILHVGPLGKLQLGHS